MNCHENIKNKRVQLQLTQQQLADKIGVSRQTVVRWENGWTIPTLYYAQKLAEAFGITVSELMTGVPTADAQKPVPCMSAKVARFIVVSILPLALYYILYFVITAWRRYIAINGGVTGDIRTSAMYDALRETCLLATVCIGVFWIIRLFEEWRGTSDGFLRYEIYRKWNVGLFFYIVVLLTMLGVFYIPGAFPFILVIAVCIAAPIDFVFDFVFKKICAKKMTVTQNRKLYILNLIFTIIAAASIVALIIWAICFFAALSPSYLAPDWGLGLLFVILYTSIAMFVMELCYIVARIIICARLTRKE